MPTPVSGRTSATHPLQIAEVRPALASGRIGITFCPGKKQADALTGSWNRDLATDLDAIAAWGACALVTLVEEHELHELAVADMGEQVRCRHMAWFHLPISDYNVPDSTFETRWDESGAQLRALLAHGFDIVIHCKGGLGRAGMIAARLLVELGKPADEAIRSVRAVRPGAIETVDQERYLLRLAEGTFSLSPRCSPDRLDRSVGMLVGLASGDAVGTTLEFTPRDSRALLRDMVGGGLFQLEPGQWTDDTAMALALAASVLEHGRLDESDLIAKFAQWRDEGSWSCTGRCFDIGITTSAAIDRWQRSGDPFAGSSDPMTAGNGSLMRLAPVAIAFAADPEALRDAAVRQSLTTHAAPAAVAACEAYAMLLADVLSGLALDDALVRLAARAGAIEVPEIAAIAAGSWRGKRRRDIRSSGYVVHSLEAAIWCVARSSSFEEAVLTAANLGDDADTTAAIAGQLAGALYGASGIPAHWLEKLAWRGRIVSAARGLAALHSAQIEVEGQERADV